jgi:hypothetical protein
MALIPLPPAWRNAVCAVLKAGKAGTDVQWTRDAKTRFESDGTAAKARAGSTDPVWEYEAQDAFVQFLNANQPMGCPVTMAKPPGECYEFFFRFYGERFYGKILLRADRRQVVIFSAHKPLKPSLSCE